MMAGDIIPWIATGRNNLTRRTFTYFTAEVTHTAVTALTRTGTATGCRGPGQQVCFGGSTIVAVVTDGVVIRDRTTTAAIFIAVHLSSIRRRHRGWPVWGHGFPRRRRSGGRTNCCFRVRGSSPSLRAGRGRRGRWTAAVTPASCTSSSASTGDRVVAVASPAGNQSARAVAGPRTAAIIAARRR
jgi:hypothetical protein